MAKGSIEKRGKNTWRLTVDLGYHPDGTRNRPRKPITIDNPDILKSNKLINEYLNEELYRFKKEVESGEYIKPEKMTFEQFVLNEWMEKYAKDPENLSPTTLDIYERVIHTRLIPEFGHKELIEIKTLSIVTFLKNLEKPGARRPPKTGKPLTEKQINKLAEPLDASTIAYVYRVLKNIFTRAVEWQLIKKNPMQDVKKPADKNAKVKILAQRKNPQFYDEIEAQQVVDALYNASRKWRLLILGSMIGGFRRGELVGLEWPFVNFQQEVISVENNIPLTKEGEAIEKGPKSTASYRDVDMPKWYMDELSRYKDEWEREKKFLADKWEGADRQFVFHNGKGKPYYYQHPTKWWKRFCERHGIRYIKFHGLRHSSGTLLLEDEEEGNFDSILIAIQRRLGHARLSTTSDIYVHITKKVKKRTAGKFDKFARNNQ
ncbi:tyrosine-type recombinase/integrase [Paenibacillus lautus]|uniref:tyrosine-type recombinase/integrase n=1 Tax=Paenibacillus lautus TaxID=1401 RepID=UPI0039872987